MNILKELVTLATHLDKRGFVKEADYLDKIVKKSQQAQQVQHALPSYVNDDWIRTRVASPKGVEASKALEAYNQAYTQNGQAILRSINSIDVKGEQGLPREERRRIRAEGTPEERETLRANHYERIQNALSMLGGKAFEEIKQTLGMDPREADMGQALPTAAHLFVKWAPIVMFGAAPGSLSMAEGLSLDTPGDITKAMSGLSRLIEEGSKIAGSNLPDDAKAAAQLTVDKAGAALSAIGSWVSDPSLAPRV